MAKSEKGSVKEPAQLPLRTCFIISPFGHDASDTRRKAEGLIDAVIKPVLADLNFKAISSLDISKPGSISNQVIEHLLNDDLVVANLTGLNPNVMYELAVRHARRLPVVSLVENTTILPFDIVAERTVFFEDDMKGVVSLKPHLQEAVLAAMDDKHIDNPVYRVVQQSIIQADVEKGSFQDFILKRLNSIDDKLIGGFNQHSTYTRKPDQRIWKQYVVETHEGYEDFENWILDKLSVLEVEDYKIFAGYGEINKKSVGVMFYNLAGSEVFKKLLEEKYEKIEEAIEKFEW